jgi:hypothetical protein
MKNKSRHVIYFAIIVISLVAALRVQFPGLLNEYIISNDVMQHTYWMEHFHDETLFGNDIYVQFDRYVAPVGFKALYFLITLFADPVMAGKYLAIILYLLTGVLMYKLGEVIRDKYTGLILFLLFIQMPAYLDDFAGGLHRAFAYPLLAMFLYLLLTDKLKRLPIVLIFMIFFYPTLYLTAYLCLILYIYLRRKVKSISFSKRDGAWIFLASNFVFLVVLCLKIISKPDFLGKITNLDTILVNYDLFVYGRSSEAQVSSMVDVIYITMLHGRKTFLLPLLIVFWNYYYWRHIIRPFNERAYFVIITLFLSSLIMYTLAIILLFKLYLPIKYVQYPLLLLSMLIFTLAAGVILSFIKRGPRKILALITILVFSYHIYTKGLYPIGEDIEDQSQYAALYEFIGELPEDVVIAANPYLSDFISCFSKRKVFLKYELSYPFFENYARIIQGRIDDFYKAYYSSKPEDVKEFCKANNIEYIVVNSDDFLKKGSRNPFLERAQTAVFVENILKTSHKDPFLKSVRDEDKLFSTDDNKIFVVRADEKKFTTSNDGKDNKDR